MNINKCLGVIVCLPFLLAIPPPHIVVIVIDDLGWNDVSWNNADSFAKNLGELANSGIILDRHYVHAACTPSRAALLTGKYAWRLGLQRGNIERYQPLGLGTKHKLLPEYLKDAGYKSHAVGKWHLGYCNNAYLPTRRGFDTFFGLYSDATHYRSRLVTCDDFDVHKDEIGYDLRRNENITQEYRRRFSPNMFAKEAREIILSHDQRHPMFLYLPLMSLSSPHVGNAPRRFRHLYDSSTTTGFQSSDIMRDVTLLTVDYALKEVVKELQDNGMYDNSIILVTTDNGGEPWYSNQPLRGSKDTVYEGGIRAASFVLSPLLGQSKGFRYQGLMHLVDWLPTFLEAGGLPLPDDIDGISMWNALKTNDTRVRDTVIHNIDEDVEDGTLQAAITHNNYKLIWGQEFLLGRSQFSQADNVQLYDVVRDPEERRNIADSHQDIVSQLQAKIMDQKEHHEPARTALSTKRGWPSNFGGYLSPGWCEALP